MKVLITGSNGLLGQKLVAHLLTNHISFIATSKGKNRNPECPKDYYLSLDITQIGEINDCLKQHDFTHIIHTAAMTNVDACEKNPKECLAINHHGTTLLFNASRLKDIHFTLLSTDFVFDGIKGNYAEEDTPNPLSIYGKSKWMAEQELLKSDYSNWAIARTIIVYGKGYHLNKSNIFSWLLEELSLGRKVSLITDHFRAPTWAEDLASGCMAIVNKNHRGIFHLSGPETLSIYELGLRVAHYLNADPSLVMPIDSSTLNQLAPRPPKSGFKLDKAKNELGYQPHTIEETLSFLLN